MNSEEQWNMVGTCPDCDAPLYQMGDRIVHKDGVCPYQYMDTLVDRITHDYVVAQLKPHKLERLVRDILNVT
jgi:hypothetical protein